MSDQRKPEVLSSRWVTHSRLFHVEEQQLRFSNGVERSYERLNPGHHGAVMVVAVDSGGRMALVREYGAGIGDYYLSFPKGALQPEESVLDAGNRELMEDRGVGRRRGRAFRHRPEGGGRKRPAERAGGACSPA